MIDTKTRYVSSFIIEFISDFICYCNYKNGLSADEIAILCLLASESTREVRNNAFALKNYGDENDVLPDKFRPPLSLKIIHTRLGMARETTRRKLENLASRNLIHKVNGGYIFPAQIGGDDYTKDIRLFLVERLKSLKRYIENVTE